MGGVSPALYVRIHRSHALTVRHVRPLRPQLHGEFLVVLVDGAEITSGGSDRAQVQDPFGLR